MSTSRATWRNRSLWNKAATPDFGAWHSEPGFEMRSAFRNFASKINPFETKSRLGYRAIDLSRHRFIESLRERDMIIVEVDDHDRFNLVIRSARARIDIESI